MLPADQFARLSVVLVRARNPANIGAVARAMHDFGFPSLRIANEFPVPFEAARSAIDASAVLAAATTHTSVAEAIADCTLVIGTTAVGERDLNHPLLTLAEAAPSIRAELARPSPGPDAPPRVALLFGSEKTGLSNEELSHCHWLLTIPMQQHADLRHPSMNLGQAVAVCLYELVRDTHATESVTNNPASSPRESNLVTNAPVPADAATQERLTTLLLEVLDRTEYTRRHAANADPAQVRRLVRRMGADATDAPVWTGILRQILWKLGVNRED